MSQLTHFLCAAVGGNEVLDSRAPHYLGWSPLGPPYWYNDGKGYLLNRKALHALYLQLSQRARTERVDDCSPSFTPFNWARGVVHVPPRNMRYNRATECCPLYGVTAFDVMIGVCLRWASVPITSIGDDRTGWWARIFVHGGPMKHATRLRAAYEFLRNNSCHHDRCRYTSVDEFRALYLQ